MSQGEVLPVKEIARPIQVVMVHLHCAKCGTEVNLVQADKRMNPHFSEKPKFLYMGTCGCGVVHTSEVQYPCIQYREIPQ